MGDWKLFLRFKFLQMTLKWSLLTHRHRYYWHTHINTHTYIYICIYIYIYIYWLCVRSFMCIGVWRSVDMNVCRCMMVLIALSFFKLLLLCKNFWRFFFYRVFWNTRYFCTNLVFILTVATADNNLSLSLSLYIYIYIYVCVCVCVCKCI